MFMFSAIMVIRDNIMWMYGPPSLVVLCSIQSAVILWLQIVGKSIVGFRGSLRYIQ